MTTTAKGIPKLSTSAFIKDGPTDINAALDAADALIDQHGKSIIATSETRTNTAYGLMTTPDRVQNVVLPTDGLIMILFTATWQASVTNAGRAAIFIGSNQLKVPTADKSATSASAVQEASTPTFSAMDATLTTEPRGLLSMDARDITYTGDATTGQAIALNQTSSGGISGGGPCYVFAAAGIYDVSVQFKSSSGSVTVKNRKLWVRALGF